MSNAVSAVPISCGVPLCDPWIKHLSTDAANDSVCSFDTFFPGRQTPTPRRQTTVPVLIRANRLELSGYAPGEALTPASRKPLAPILAKALDQKIGDRLDAGVAVGFLVRQQP